MLKDELIALGLRAGKPAAAPATGEAGLRAAVEKLLTLLRDCVGTFDLADEGVLHAAIETCREAVASARDAAAIAVSIDACNDACRRVLAEMERQRLEQKQEIATLVDMVREALAIVAGDGQSFNHNLGNSMKRFEALVHINDVRQLKAQLVHEVAELRHIAEERQKTWEETCQKFSQKVDTLERQLTTTRQEAALDPLTRVGNRGAFDRECHTWLKGEHSRFVLAMLDIDHFKAINDTHGHAVGDRAIIAVAQALKHSVRADCDFVARVGGDEFAVLVAGLNLQQAEVRMRMLAASLSAVSFETANAPLKLTVSCGVAEISAGDTVESLMQRADEALYEAKHLGRNRVISKAKPTLRDLMRH